MKVETGRFAHIGDMLFHVHLTIDMAPRFLAEEDVPILEFPTVS